MSLAGQFALLQQVVRQLAPGARLICRTERGGFVSDAALICGGDAAQMAAQLNRAQGACIFAAQPGGMLLGRLEQGVLAELAERAMASIPPVFELPASDHPFFF